MSEPPPADRTAPTVEHVPVPPAPSASVSEAPTLPPPEVTPAPSPEPCRIASLPGFEVLGELGRGAMGVVYKARQLKLNRTVALKMILAGDHAGEGDRSRFRAEAEAIAQLQHPHIVQVYDIGEHEGRPYLALEYCPGGSLADRLDGTPWTAGRAAGLVETLARAMHAAHLHHVVHRDLKPANVLLMEECGRVKGKSTPHERAVELVKALAGTAEEQPADVTPVTPKVTDFGLAKKLDQAGQTQSGAILGTPSYMAPEQAGGRGKEVGPAADVYALGAILYELLTGRPPFRAATTFDTLMQVIHDEPVPPTQLQPRTPRDLETICLKCLQKDPRRRYETAEDLADDLRRFIEGRPIVARPVGTLERVIKLVRRRPAVAGLVAGIVAALTAGTVVSWHFAVEADKRAKDAEASALTAIANEKKAREKEELEKRARAEVEETLARSLLRPMGHREEPANAIELEALWELAGSTNDRVRLLFIEKALEQPQTARQLRNRREMALHAAVGLDRARQRRAVELLLARLRDDHSGMTIREDCAWMGIALGDPSLVFVKEAARALTAALAEETDPRVLSRLAENLEAVSGRLGTEEARAAARALTNTIVGKNLLSSEAFARALCAVSGRLSVQDAGTTAVDLADAMERTADPFSQRFLAEGLGAVSGQLSAEEATRQAGTAARVLAAKMAQTTDPRALAQLARGLRAVVSRLSEEEANQLTGIAARALTKAMTARGVGEPDLFAVAEGFHALSDRLGEEEAAFVARAFINSIAKEKISVISEAWRQIMWAVSGRLGAEEAEAVARALADALFRAADGPFHRAPLARMLQALAGRLGAEEAGAIARTLTDVMTKTSDPHALEALAQSLGVAMGRTTAGEASQLAGAAARALDRALPQATDPDSLWLLARALQAVVGRLSAEEAAVHTKIAFRALTRALDRSTDSDDLAPLARGFQALADWLSAEDAAAAASALNAALTKTTNPAFTQALEVLLNRLDIEEADRQAAAAARTLIDAMAQATYPDGLKALVEGLQSVSGRGTPEESAARSVLLTRTITESSHPFPCLSLLPTLSRAVQPLPSRFSTQQLVDVLKMPTFVGPARRVILDQLGQRYQRTFADQWEFVDFAEKNLPEIDLLSPPKRPRK